MSAGTASYFLAFLAICNSAVAIFTTSTGNYSCGILIANASLLIVGMTFLTNRISELEQGQSPNHIRTGAEHAD